MEEKVLRDYLFKEAEIVQDIISRMSTNQFYIKGWSITLVVASLLLKGNFYHHFVAFIPWFIFWVYDSYFLRLEKLYRLYYNWLIANRLEKEDFLLEMDRTNLEKMLKESSNEQFLRQVPCRTQIMFSKPIISFYLFLLIAIIFMIFIDYWTQGININFN